MRPFHRLATLNTIVHRRALFLRTLIEPYSPPLLASSDRVVAFVTIETLNLWATSVRSFYLSSAIRARRLTGARVLLGAATFSTAADAMTFAVHHLKGHSGSGPWASRDEPTWHDTHTLLTLASVTGASNLTEIQKALSYQTSFFKTLPTARNFFAHRNEETARKARALARTLGVSSSPRPSNILCSRASGRPQNVLADWLDDLRNVVELMCQ